MPDTRAHDEVYCPDCGLQWVASQGVQSAGCRHLDLTKRPSQMDDDELLRLVLWLADGGVRRQAPSEPDWSADDYRIVRACWAGSPMTARISTSPLPSAPGRRVSDRHDPGRHEGERLRVVAWAADLARRRHRRQPAGLVHEDDGAGDFGGARPGVLVVAARQQARDQSGGSQPQVPLGRPGPLSMGAGVGPSDSRPEPEPTKPEPEPPPKPTRPPEPEPPKPEAISEETLGKVERFGDRLGRGI
jgi:hypothetical protein